ncbi:unnamed protein product [Trichogramma brassicae]|uniref:Uncharacterized protein n=1 Tax=Trichogramma brassicae TaxID=86971 RepID=A0A6H5IN53_9HYME|nr:unnamed protein product [Trichogramma brassicae]
MRLIITLQQQQSVVVRPRVVSMRRFRNAISNTALCARTAQLVRADARSSCRTKNNSHNRATHTTLGLVPAASGDRWRGGSTGHPRHRRPGGVHGDARPVHALRRGLHDLLLGDRSAQLPGGTRVSQAHHSGARQRGHTPRAGGQQVRPAAEARGEHRRGPRSRRSAGLSVLRDVGGAEAVHRRRLPLARQADTRQGALDEFRVVVVAAHIASQAQPLVEDTLGVRLHLPQEAPVHRGLHCCRC